jgi:hypothetical protein
MGASSEASLDARSEGPTIDPVIHRVSTYIMMVVRRFQENIGGRVYQIEASRVQADRWRAQIARLPGMPTSLMPFYGQTADEAARLLFEWLARAHRGASTTA